VAGRKLAAADVPTPGPWLVRGEAGEGASTEDLMLGVEPATDDRPGGWPYLIRRDQAIEPGESHLHIAIGIQRLADAKLMGAAPELAEALLRLLTSPDLLLDELDPRTREVMVTAWALLVRVAPHLEI